MCKKDKSKVVPLTQLEKSIEKLEKAEEIVISEELVRWMTEGTNPNLIPRSDGG